MQELGAAIRYRTGLSDRVREIAILGVAAATDCAFERYAHERVGRAAGLTEAELEALACRTFTSGDPVETAAYALCERLEESVVRLSDAEYAAAERVLGREAILELVALVGYYRTLAQLMAVFEVGQAPPG